MRKFLGINVFFDKFVCPNDTRSMTAIYNKKKKENHFYDINQIKFILT